MKSHPRGYETSAGINENADTTTNENAHGRI
jgi:hypothetical protein